ncbi:quinone oxidoreductase [Viridothelium virens]|uniref:Quinone oxidoreductase n=1 Tax=Viridothelium virens TaxID=1048519 RepID=A0A6A6GRY5_VIRVR|nr:quinone oxidoreductase [Viridothelium virens]
MAISTEHMRAIDVRGGTGPATALFVNEEVPKPTPGPHECLVRVRAFGLNRGDIVQRQGLYPMPPTAPKTLGLEFSGVVVSVGEEAYGWWGVDAEVFGLVYGGAYAEYVVAHKNLLIAKPATLSWAMAGGMCESWFTALQALYLVGCYDFSSTRSIVWNAGASTISICGIQLSRALGVKVFATTRQDSKRDFCTEQLGCTGAINTRALPETTTWVDEIRRMNGGEGIDLIIDFIGGSCFSSLLDLAARDGRIVNLGLLGGPTTEGNAVDISPFVMKRLRYEGSTLRSRDIEYQAKVRALFEATTLPKLLEGEFKHHIEKTFQWVDIVSAHELMESNQAIGKIVCVIDW